MTLNNYLYSNTRAYHPRWCINTRVFERSKVRLGRRVTNSGLTLSRSLQQGMAAKIS